MKSDVLIVNGIAALIIILVILWFFGGRSSADLAESDVPITILIKDGVYQPSYIQIPSGKAVTLRFLRYDTLPCASSVQFTQLNLAYSLPMNKPIDITIPPQPAGEIEFTCQVGTYRGRIIIV